MATRQRGAGIFIGLSVALAAACAGSTAFLARASQPRGPAGPSQGLDADQDMLDLYDPMVCFGPDTRSLQWPHRHVPAAPAGFAVWQALQTKIDFPFGDGTSLANALNHIKQQVGKSAPPGFQLNIYVDPIGLLEADKSPASPVTLELEAVPANSGLALLLRQLGLAHFVRDDGIVVIDPELSEVFPHDRDYEVLHQIQILSAEVDQLKALLSVAAESRTNPQGEAAGPARKAQ